MNLDSKVHFTKDGFVSATINEWEELLSKFSLDEIQLVYFQILPINTRVELRKYMSERMLAQNKY